MKRREVLKAIGAAAVTSMSINGDATAREKHLSNAKPGFHFLSAQNPLATVEQRDMDALALKVMQAPAIAQARKAVELQWRAATGHEMSEQAEALFDGMITEYIFVNILKAVNSDVNYPKVSAASFAPPHEWFGLKIPGSRCAGPNPDNTYRHIPIDPGARYELSGKLFEPSAQDFIFSLMSNLLFTRKLSILEKPEVKIDSDGSFVVSLGPEEANGRANHMQSTPSARWLFIRDSRTDWNQKAVALAVRRLDPPTAPPMTVDQIVMRATELMWDDLPYTYWWIAVAMRAEVNAMTQPKNTGAVGGLATQQTSFGRANLADDEAMVVTLNRGGASYRSLSLYDRWYRNIDPGLHMSSMTNDQATANADGTVTHVISSRDPGVWNWLDAAGLRELFILQRWQGLPKVSSPENRLTVATKLVKIDELQSVLPAGMKIVTAEERKAQVSERRAQYHARFIES